jgi:hypothetical protein
MLTPPVSHLGALREGFRLLRRHPGLAAGLAVLALGLAQLGPALEIAAGAGPNPMILPLFALAGLLPLEMFFLPRFQAQLDAETCDVPGNPVRTWQATFDGRWVKAFLARLGLSVVIGLGLALFLIPGIVILTLFGWAPLRMLLRGDSLLDALKWSQAAMARHWPRIVQAVLTMLLIALLYQMVAGWILGHLLPPADPNLGPSALLRLKHPAFWAFNFLGGALNLWLTCALLALYHRLEALVR